jgi:hypothetical protein
MDLKRIMNREKNYRVYDQEYTGLNSIAMVVLVLLGKWDVSRIYPFSFLP